MNSYPDIPVELMPDGIGEKEALHPLVFERDMEKLWSDICFELTDTQFTRRTHHNRKTYQVGCHGPLCLKANRDWAYRRASVGAPPATEARKYDLLILFFGEQAKKRIAEQEAAMMERIQYG